MTWTIHLFCENSIILQKYKISFSYLQLVCTYIGKLVFLVEIYFITPLLREKY